MRLYEKADERAADEIRKFANANVCDSEKISSEDFTYIFDEEKAICTFMLKDKNEFRSPLLKTCYHLSVTQFGFTTDGKHYVQPLSHEKAEKIVRLFFPETKKVWEHSPFTKKGVSAVTHHFYLFVSIPYGKKPVNLQAVTAAEKTRFFRRKQVPKKSHNTQSNYI